ncbi:hypothetical protein JCM21900_002518 [Sporobolomyces salmonicolor]
MSSAATLHPAGTTSYAEPPLPRLLTLISLLYLVQLARAIANYLFGAGLLGEIAIGVIYGPVAHILPLEWEETFIVVGYIGLVLIVFEGGLTLHPRSFLPLLPLALVTALLGILLPLAFTFALFSAPTFDYPPLQAFTAGSALASTSLGTTFFVLKAAGGDLERTRVGNVLKGAALIDDVVALVLLSVIQSLGTGSGDHLGWTVGQPIVASVVMAFMSPCVARWIFRPLFRLKRVEELVEKGGQPVALLLGTTVLSAYLAISYYTGTTVLLGAFLAGMFLPSLPSPSSSISFLHTYETLILPVQEHLFVPLFFASIGFSIPFLQLWTGRVAWRGIVYALLMALGKVLAGAPILAVDLLRSDGARTAGEGEGRSRAEGVAAEGTAAPSNTEAEKAASPRSRSPAQDGPAHARDGWRGSKLRESLPAAGFLGVALVARGEIGILVLQVAYDTSSASSSPVLSTEPYLVAIWAVALCTIVGPVAFSALVKARWGRGIASGPWGVVGKGEEARAEGEVEVKVQ